MSVNAERQKRYRDRQRYAKQAESVTPTDEELILRKPGYYIFSECREAMCFECYKKFATRLVFLKFCSIDCKELYLAKHFLTMGKNPESTSPLAAMGG